MKFTNLMEERVQQLTNEYLESIDKEKDSKLAYDIIVYCLNRLPAHYVLSGRGILHTTRETEKPQTTADILKVIHEAHSVVSKRREDELPDELASAIPTDGHYIIYPQIMGTVYNCDNFTRIKEARVSVFEDDVLLPSYNSNFPNPYTISDHTRGQYVFRFSPKKVESDKDETVVLNIKVEAEGYEPYDTFIKINLPAHNLEAGSSPDFSKLVLDHIYLSKPEDE